MAATDWWTGSTSREATPVGRGRRAPGCARWFCLALSLALLVIGCHPPAALVPPAPGPSGAPAAAWERVDAAPPQPAASPGGASDPAAASATSPAASRLANWPGALEYGAPGEIVAAFGFAPEVAREVLFPVTRTRALPPEYRPTDLVRPPGSLDGVLARAVLVTDLRELLAAARQDGRPITVVSGYRSYATQQALFEGRVRDRLAQARGAITPDEAREQANRGTALPGHSQHQLGTALDVSAPEAGYRIGPFFAATGAALWLRERAWEFGFVIPYTEAGRARTGYIAEPWHLRWVGRPLAAYLMAERYLEAADPVVDDYLEALAVLLDGEPPQG